MAVKDNGIKNLQNSDPEIIEKILDGEPAFFEILIRKNNGFLYKLGRAYGYNHHDTEDLMQETYLDAFKHLDSFQNRSSFKTWIHKIMLNKCHYKKSKFNYRNELPVDHIMDKSVPMFSSGNRETEKEVINSELRHVIEQALERIPFDYRMVFSLREMNGLNVADTAEVMGISENNVKVRLNRARGMLRNEVQKMYLPGDLFEFHLTYCNRLTESVMSAISRDMLS